LNIQHDAGRGPASGCGLVVLVRRFDVDPATPRKTGTPTPTQFLAHVFVGQMAGWMKMPLGMEGELGPGHCTRRGASSRERAQQPPKLLI